MPIKGHATDNDMSRGGNDGSLDSFLEIQFDGSWQFGCHNLGRKLISGGILSEIPPDGDEVFQETPSIPKVKVREDMVIMSGLAGMAVNNACHSALLSS